MLEGDSSRRTHGLSLHALSSGRWGAPRALARSAPEAQVAPGTVACCRRTDAKPSFRKADLLARPRVTNNTTWISYATLCTSEAAGLGHPSPSHRLRRETNPGTLPEVTPPSWKGRLQPKAGEHVWGRSQRCARKRWIMPSSTRSHPTPIRCSQLHVPLPGSQVTGRAPGSPTSLPPPLLGYPERRSSLFSCLRVFLEKVLETEK